MSAYKACAINRMNTVILSAHTIGEDSTETITQTCPCIMQRFLKDLKMIIFSSKFFIFFLLLLKTLIVGTR